MHTPLHFISAHVAPAVVPPDAHVFAFRDGALLVGGNAEAPSLPRLGELQATGIEGTTHYLGMLGGIDCVALLGPLAVMPSRQRQGVGRTLIRAGFDRLAQGIVRRVLVLGDPAYYGRFGFLRENSILPPYELPAAWTAAWQSISLGADAARIAGKLRPTAAWLQPALWAP